MPRISSSDLQINQPIEADAPDATLTIAIDPNNPMPVGSYRFQLVVQDDAGNDSQPTTFVLTILDDQAPTAIIIGPDRVGFGADFTLSGAESTDAGGGQIVRFEWTLLQRP